MAGHSFDTKAEHNRLSYIFEETQDISLIGEYFAWNLGTRVTEHNHQDTIGHFAYQEINGQWTANGQTLHSILNPPQELIDQIEDYQPVSDQFKNGLHAVEHGMIGDKSVKQAVYVSPISNDSAGQYSVIYYFTRDEYDPSKINVNPITFRGTDSELQKVLQTLNKDVPSFEGTLSFETPGFVRSEVISKMDLFDAIRKTLEPNANKVTKEYLARLESDLTLYEELETLQAHRIEYLKELTLEYLREGLKDGTFFQRLRDLADGAPELAEWLTKQEKLDPTFYNKGVRAPIFEVKIEETIQKEMLPLFVIGWGDVARKEAAAAAGVEKGEQLPPPRYLEPYFRSQETTELRKHDSIIAPLQRIAQDIYRTIVPESPIQLYPLSRRTQDEVPSWLRDNEDLLRRARHQAFLESLITKKSSSHVVFNSSSSEAKVASSEGLNRFFGPTNFKVAPSPGGSMPIDFRTAMIASMIRPVTAERTQPSINNYPLPDRPVRISSNQPSKSSPKVSTSSVFSRRKETFRRSRIQPGVRRLTSKSRTEREKYSKYDKFQRIQIKQTRERDVLAIHIKFPRFLVRFLRNAKEVFSKRPSFSIFTRNHPIKGNLTVSHLMAPSNKSFIFRVFEKIQMSFTGFRLKMKLPFLQPRMGIGSNEINASLFRTNFKAATVTEQFIEKIKTQLTLSIPLRETISVGSVGAIRGNEFKRSIMRGIESPEIKPISIKPLSVSNRRNIPIQATYEPLVLKAIMESRNRARITSEVLSDKKIEAEATKERSAEAINIFTKNLTNASGLKSFPLLHHSEAKLAEKKLEVLTMLQLEAKSREIDFFEFLSQAKVRTFKKSKYYLESLIIALMEALGISDLDQLEILKTLGITENDARQISSLLKEALELHERQMKVPVIG